MEAQRLAPLGRAPPRPAFVLDDEEDVEEQGLLAGEQQQHEAEPGGGAAAARRHPPLRKQVSRFTLASEADDSWGAYRHEAGRCAAGPGWAGAAFLRFRLAAGPSATAARAAGPPDLPAHCSRRHLDLPPHAGWSTWRCR